MAGRHRGRQRGEAEEQEGSRSIQSTKFLTTQMLEARMELGYWDIGLSPESLYVTLAILEFNM